MKKLFFTVKEWNRFAWSMQEVICKKYDVILTDYKTRKEKTILLLNKINMKNFNKGMDTFNKSLNKFSKTVDSLTRSISQDKNAEERSSYSKEEIWGKESVSIWGKPIGLSNNRVSIWPEKTDNPGQSNKNQKTGTEIW